MQSAGILSGGAPVVKKYQASATGYLAGAMALFTASNASGQLSISTTTSWARTLGLIQDGYALTVGVPYTYSVTQGDPVALTSVIVNPDLILRALLVGSATNAVLTDNPVVTASSNGLTAVLTNSVASPQMDEGTIWYTSGANAGKARKITATSTVTATVVIPFLANAIGDHVLHIAHNIGSRGVTMGTNLLNVRGDVALGSDAEGTCLDMELNGAGNSYLQLIANRHNFSIDFGT